MRKDISVVALADLHTGHIGSVTPPDFWWPEDSNDPKVSQVAKAQRETWQAYNELVNELGPADVVVVNGDLIDGPGKITAGTEHYTTDIFTQAKVAAQLILMWRPKYVFATYGTSYHTTIDGQDAEKFVIELVRKEGPKAYIDSHAFFHVNRRIFDVKHYAGRPVLPQSRGTPLGRERLANILWAIRGEQPQADVILRAHIHSFAMAGGVNPDWLAFFQPCLLAAMTKYGARMCSFPIDWGILFFTISPKGTIAWEVHTRSLGANAREARLVEVGNGAREDSE